MKPLRPFALALLPSLAAAQHVAWSVATPTGVAATASAGTSASQSLPAGPLPAAGALAASPGPAASAGFTWSADRSATLARFQLANQVQVAAGAPPGSGAAVGVHELVLTLSPSSPLAIGLSISGAQTHAFGTAPGPLSVDVGDDGVAEYTFEGTGPFATTLTLATPLTIRVRAGCSITGAGAATSSLQISVTPANELQVQTAVIGCLHLGPALSVTPAFAGSGVRIVADASPLIPAVLVLGVSAQPLLLPPFQSTPCLVMPAPHVLLLRVDPTPFDLALPAAVRPVTVWAQSVLLAPQQLVTSTGYRITASL